ncbi:ty1-copia retrotransposon protein [Cucumis melo var. makuwa]|uniref:Ty1-copia retrotransposon protein n=1 Tax=Cucumis melo var. makuwa TaxID=1194695 RepID=A0A5D3E0B3_CUCMM|nr:ty1-copia retrotransposon protein [Cucumis melo var. makuwa]TYK29346.1 ty1-copia retrotransposon protein [Cucumis melo var. makuwa]
MHGSCSGLRTGPEGNEIGVGKAELKREDVARSKWNVRLELNGTECRGSKRSNGEECHGSEPSLNVMDLNRMIELEQLEVDYVLTTDLPSSNPPTTTSTSSDPKSSTGPSTTVAVADQDIWSTLESRYGGDDPGRKKYVLGKWLQFQMTDNKRVVEQIHEYESLVANVLSEDMKMCEILQANVLLEKFPPSWNGYRNHLKHKKKDLKLQELISHMRREEANRLKDKLASQNLNSVNANLVESSIVNRDITKQEKGHKGKYSEKRQFKTPGGQIKKKKLVCYVSGKEGHKSYQCNQRKGRPSQKPTPQANLAKQDSEIIAAIVEVNLIETRRTGFSILEP